MTACQQSNQLLMLHELPTDRPTPNTDTMSDIVPGIRTIDELRSFIQATLCLKENLLLEQSKLRQAPLVKQGKLCGFQFSVQGPRQVRLGAVWASEHNDIYFYDTRGNRYHKVHLPEPIALAETAVAVA